MRFTRDEVLDRLRAQIAVGNPIVGAGAGTGISAKAIEDGGADLIVVYNSGRFRMAGHSSICGLLPLSDANSVVIEMGEREILPIVDHTPVIAGVNGVDPTRDMSRLLAQLQDIGFSGVNNFPTVALHEGRMRQELESSNLGFGREVEMIRRARALDLFTIVYVCAAEEAAEMAEAGADAVVVHLGLTVGGMIGMDAEIALALNFGVEHVQKIGRAAVKARPDVILLCHGGPIATPDDAAYVLERTDAVGFIGASSMERIPVEAAISATTQSFKSALGT